MNLALPRGRLVGEFFLIVIGVLAALMVDTWIEQRSNDKLGQEYLSRLSDDLQADWQALEYRISFFTSVRSLALDTLNNLNSDETVDQDALLAAYYAAEIFSFRAITNTYEDLQNTGNIGLLNDIDLRLALASYHSKTTALSDVISQEYRELVRGVIPFEVQAAIRKHCPTTDATDEMPTGFPPCTLPDLSESDVNEIFVKLRSQPRIAEILTYRVSEVDVTIYLYSVLKGSVSEVIGHLEKDEI
jgi:hypothetical protein